MRYWQHRRRLYNRRSELAAATIGTNLYGYEYDTIGNRLWSADNVITNAYAANNLNQYSSILRASAPPREPTYDADGNMTGDSTFAYAYDAENRLISVFPVLPSVGLLAVENRYDHKHRRVRKTVKRFDGGAWDTVETHTFVWDGNNIVLEKVEFANGTTRTSEYFWGMGKSGTEQGAGGVGGLLAVSSNGQFYFPTFDNNGNVAKYIGESGNAAAAYEYDDFGRIVSQSGPLADFFRHRFSTKYFDGETGLHYFDYRFYSPLLMRWFNRDPMEEDGGVNLYCFVENAPPFSYDAFGMRRSNLIGIVLDGLCEDAYNFAKRFLHTPQELRAWDRYTKHGWRGRSNDIELPPDEVKAIAESVNAVTAYVQEKRSSCKKGIKFSVSTSIGGAAPSPWVKALGGVSIQVSTSCNDGCFSYVYDINDLYDFDIKGLSGFKSRGWAGQLGTIGVNWTETCLKCDWQTFYHKGAYSSK